MIRVPRDRETPISTIQTGGFTYRYAYARSADTRTADDYGQDYLALHRDGKSFAFALCDGVSQSFYGDLAADYLGNSLVGWVWNTVPVTYDEPLISGSLTAHLHDLTEGASKLLANQQLPDDIPSMLREVLEEKRAIGSQSMFVCGRIDLPCHELPAGRVVLAWMGDSRLRVWGPDGERSSVLGDTFKTAERWSSCKGPVGGDPHVFVSPLDANGYRSITRLMAYSDGLACLDHIDSALSNQELQGLMTEEGKSPTSDDMSFLEVWLGHPPVDLVARPSPLRSS